MLWRERFSVCSSRPTTQKIGLRSYRESWTVNGSSGKKWDNHQLYCSSFFYCRHFPCIIIIKHGLNCSYSPLKSLISLMSLIHWWRAWMCHNARRWSATKKKVWIPTALRACSVWLEGRCETTVIRPRRQRWSDCANCGESISLTSLFLLKSNNSCVNCVIIVTIFSVRFHLVCGLMGQCFDGISMEFTF